MLINHHNKVITPSTSKFKKIFNFQKRSLNQCLKEPAFLNLLENHALMNLTIA